MEFNENSDRKVYNIDIDGILTNGELFWEEEPSPNMKNIEVVNRLYREGNIIIIHTARQWTTAPETIGWLIKNKIPFHGIMMSKGGSDCYIDDKAYNSFEAIRRVVKK